MWLYVVVTLLTLLVYFLVRKRPVKDQPLVRTKPFLVRAGTLEAHPLAVSPKTANIAYANMIVSKRELKGQVFEDAALILMRRHPLLRARSIKLHGELYLEEMGTVLPSVTKRLEGDWMSEFEEQFLIPHKTDTGPLWRLVFMPVDEGARYATANCRFQYALIFGFHHSIMDGTTFLTFFKDYVRAVGRLARNELSVDDEVASLPVPVSMDYLHPGLRNLRCCDTLLGYICFFFSKVTRSALKDARSKNQWLSKFPLEQERNPGCEVKTKYLPLEFSSALTSRLISSCRSHGVSVNSALTTVIGICVAEMLQDGEVTEDIRIKQASTVSLRRWFPDTLSGQGIGCYYSAVESSILVCADWRQRFWDIVKRTGSDIHDDLKQKSLDFLKLFLLLEYLHNSGLAPSELKGKTPKRHAIVNIITNIGNYDYINDVDDDIKLTARYTGTALHTFGSIFAHSLSTVGGKLFWGLEYFPNVTRAEIAEELATRIVKAMNGLFEHEH